MSLITNKVQTVYSDGGGAAMTDDKKKTRTEDAQRINLHDEHEMEYWARKFGVCGAG